MLRLTWVPDPISRRSKLRPYRRTRKQGTCFANSCRGRLKSRSLSQTHWRAEDFPQHDGAAQALWSAEVGEQPLPCRPAQRGLAFGQSLLVLGVTVEIEGRERPALTAEWLLMLFNIERPEGSVERMEARP